MGGKGKRICGTQREVGKERKEKNGGKESQGGGYAQKEKRSHTALALGWGKSKEGKRTHMQKKNGDDGSQTPQ